MRTTETPLLGLLGEAFDQQGLVTFDAQVSDVIDDLGARARHQVFHVLDPLQSDQERPPLGLRKGVEVTQRVDLLCRGKLFLLNEPCILDLPVEVSERERAGMVKAWSEADRAFENMFAATIMRRRGLF